MEASLRRKREEIELLEKGGANEDDINAAKAKYHALSNEYAAFSKAMNLSRQRERISIGGRKGVDVSFGKQAEKAENPVAKSAESGIIKEKKVNTASEAKKVLKDKIGFDLVESSVDLVDSDLLVENTNQLQKLEDKFGIIHRSTGSVCAVNEKAGTIAYVNRKATNPLCQNLSLCPLHCSSRKALIDEMKHLVESGHSMPCLLTDSELSVYSVTHEYGHMLQNSLVQGRMKELGWDESNPRVFVDNSKKTKKARLKWYKNVDDTVKDENFREIIDIAKLYLFSTLFK